MVVIFGNIGDAVPVLYDLSYGKPWRRTGQLLLVKRLADLCHIVNKSVNSSQSLRVCILVLLTLAIIPCLSQE